MIWGKSDFLIARYVVANMLLNFPGKQAMVPWTARDGEVWLWWVVWVWGSSKRLLSGLEDFI